MSNSNLKRSINTYEDLFFIAALPRSKTSWFAATMSQMHRTICYHEALYGIKSKAAFNYRMSFAPYIDKDIERIGNSDSALVFTDFQARFPGAKTLIVHRQVEGVVKSLFDAGVTNATTPEVRNFLTNQATMLWGLDGYHLMWEDLENFDSLCLAIEHILGNRKPLRHSEKVKVNSMRLSLVEPIEMKPADLHGLTLWISPKDIQWLSADVYSLEEIQAKLPASPDSNQIAPYSSGTDATP